MKKIMYTLAEQVELDAEDAELMGVMTRHNKDDRLVDLCVVEEDGAYFLETAPAAKRAYRLRCLRAVLFTLAILLDTALLCAGTALLAIGRLTGCSLVAAGLGQLWLTCYVEDNF